MQHFQINEVKDIENYDYNTSNSLAAAQSPTQGSKSKKKTKHNQGSQDLSGPNASSKQILTHSGIGLARKVTGTAEKSKLPQS